jgi:hypothetical protein
MLSANIDRYRVVSGNFTLILIGLPLRLRFL